MNPGNKFETVIVNYFAAEKIVAEICYANSLWAEISWEGSRLMVVFYPHLDNEHWEFPCEEAIKALEYAKNKFLKRLNGRDPLLSATPLDPQQVNEQAQEILEKILNHPEKKIIEGELKRFGKILDIYAPDIGGARYSLNEEFIGFLEPETKDT